MVQFAAMLTELETLRTDGLTAITTAPSDAILREIEVEFLGRKGRLTNILRGLKDLSPEEKGQLGARANEVKNELAAAIETKAAELKNARYATIGDDEWIDPTTPGIDAPRGTLHPITQFMREAERVFTGLGFTIASGPQIEDDWHAFSALNIPADHPARDMQDTLYLTEPKGLLLRQHTSTVQIRYAETHKPPFRIVAMGKVARKDDFDASHSPMFHQMEGMMVDKNISLANMKAVMEEAVRSLINPTAKFRFRSGFFPFVEPGLELDMSCTVCDGVGCAACKYVGWLEIAGCGMIHPNVLTNVCIDPNEFSGFAFGFGIDRMVMMRHKVTDIRLLYENDLRFLKQF